MNDHPYLRAYMAGIVAPTVLLLMALTVFCFARYACNVPAPIERLIIFPMAVVPNAFGVWNMLYLRLRSHWQVPIGVHGALLPFFLAPMGAVLAISLGYLKLTDSSLVYFDYVRIPYGYLLVGPLFAVGAYYLIWKHIVGFLNELQGIN